MSKMIRSLMLVFCLALMNLVHLSAQENIRFERLSTNDGLSQADVHSFCQDKFGFIWIGTRDGLNRYDGNSFQVFRKDPDDPGSVYFNQIYDLQIDQAGNLWVGAAGGISIYNYVLDRFENFVLDSVDVGNTQVEQIAIVDQTRALIGTNKGLVTFDRKRKKILWEQEFSLFKTKAVKSVCQTDEGVMYVSTNDGLYFKSKGEASWQQRFDGLLINHLYKDKGTLYVCTSSGLFKNTNRDGDFSEVALPPGITYVEDAYRVRNGDLWVAAGQAIVLNSQDMIKAVYPHDEFLPFSLSYNSARTLYQTRDGVIWVGNAGYGVNKFNPDVSVFKYLGEHSSIPLSNNYISCIYTTNDTILFIGTLQGLDVVDLEKRTQVSFNDNQKVTKIFKDARHRVWVAGEHGIKEYVSGKLVSRNARIAKVVDVAQWSDSELVVVTAQSGIFFFDTRDYRIKTFIPPDQLSDEVTALLIEKDVIWVGAKDGLRLFTKSGELLRHFGSTPSRNTLESSFIKSLFRDSKQNLWVGTWGGGVSKLNPSDSSFQNYTVADGLANNVVYGMLEDTQGNIWLSTNLGLSAFNPELMKFKNFFLGDGLQGNEFNTSSYYKSVHGAFYFGGINGLTFFKPESVLELKRPQIEVVVTSISVNDKPYKFLSKDSVQNPVLRTRISTEPSQNDFAIGFTSVNFKYAARNFFQYSVDNSAWVNIEKRRKLELINLSSGKHTLYLRAQNSFGEWGKTYGPLTIYIQPHFWERKWFWLLSVMVLLLLVAAVYKYRARQLVQMNARLNKIVGDRTREITRQNYEIEAKNEEIMVQNDALKRQTILMEEKNLLLSNQRGELLKLSADLEQKVQERTKDIQQLNIDLVDQNMRLEQFSFIVAHNIRGPVARLKGLLSLVPSDESQHIEKSELLKYMQISMDDLDTVIGDVGQILFIRNNTRENFELVDLAEELEMAAQMLLSDKNEEDVLVDVNSFQPLKINGSKVFVQSMFYNLIQNALKFSRPNERCMIKISCGIVDGRVRIIISDNGVGIDMQYARGKIFQLYQRFTHEIPGKGFGLFLVKTEVERMGGTIAVESELGVGTTFTIEFPTVIK